MATIIDDTRSEILKAMSVLMRHRADTPDPTEKTVITSSLKELNTELDRLEQAELLEAAASVARASDAVERAIGAAKLRPFEDFLTTVGDSLKRLGQIGGDMHARERLPSAEFPDEIIPPTPAAPALEVPGPRAPTPELPSMSTKTAFSDIAAECDALYTGCKVNPDRMPNVHYYVSRLLKLKATYMGVGADLNGIPWQLVGIAHGMEAGFDFSRHLHNGDPLTDRTVQVPKGRPATGNPPFKWRESAIDALMLKGLHQVASWSRARVLYEIERFNGFGYRRRALPSPYLWSFTNFYLKGKYVRDYEFDPEAVSKQCGAAAILKGLDTKGEGIGT
jgi:lysozyme family protein